ncbi:MULTISPECIES: 2Fe-2S iron-sulfur cluster-binding protein [unclassified Bradyrhizobium]|uniref:2Fe-2S iron-sulfur cluster-binding protein n=1 Tax=unclassified Bradyrhizobium TaxID=2631580 RepID=UPI001FF8E135|nr:MULTISPECIES: 2Fe-2S iron-sulfur cluster-binding protein [unclassified Bradyrhizobium]MCK1534460.1 2Fe-2S iron-sulfur cluster binding domain-containing protein [Bradyrhizobium sp. 176]MCK1555668.1 2Fe-2S iron-sulfur cluster binding domain-containing protein [Bradyrhizobium sp. 171]
MRLTIVNRKGQKIELKDVSASTLMRAICDAGLDLAAQCGGCASCGTCHVYVEEASLSKLKPADENEDAMLDIAPERRLNSRLACQIPLSDELDGLTVTLAPGSGLDEA